MRLVLSVFALLLLLAIIALCQPRVEIAHGIPGYPVKVRVVNGTTNLYWIERGEGGLSNTWDEYIRTRTNQWWYVGTKPSNSWFRAKEMIEER